MEREEELTLLADLQRPLLPLTPSNLYRVQYKSKKDLQAAETNAEENSDQKDGDGTAEGDDHEVISTCSSRVNGITWPLPSCPITPIYDHTYAPYPPL